MKEKEIKIPILSLSLSSHRYPISERKSNHIPNLVRIPLALSITGNLVLRLVEKYSQNE